MKVNLNKSVVKVDTTKGDSGALAACALTNDGEVYCWGYDAYGQVGNGTVTTYITTPAKVLTLSYPVVDISLGGGAYGSACAVVSEPSVKRIYCWGYNGNGQLGLGHTTNVATPNLVTALTNVEAVASTEGQSGDHRCALLSNGEVWCWGYNAYGQTGDGTTATPKTTPVKVVGVNASFIEVGGANAGVSHAILKNGSVVSWGSNAVGQLGDGTLVSKSSPVATSVSLNATKVLIGGGYYYGTTLEYSTSCALTADKKVYCWGRNVYGQVGAGDTVDKNVPTLVRGLEGVQDITTGGRINGPHFCALLTTGRVKCWGYNGHGQLGKGDTVNAAVPVFFRIVD